jgi:glycerol uptake facilitator-like aquaporin
MATTHNRKQQQQQPKTLLVPTRRGGSGGQQQPTIASGVFEPKKQHSEESGNRGGGETLLIDPYDYMSEDVTTNVGAIVDVHDLWYNKSNSLHRYLRIFFLEMLHFLYYETVVAIGFRTVGDSLSFGVIQGLAFTSAVGLFWHEDCGFGNFFVAMGLCFMRLFRSREYWIFFIHMAAYIVGGFLAMAGVVLTTNDLPGLQTFGTPTKNTLIGDTAAGFSEFIGSFFLAFFIFTCMFHWVEEVRTKYDAEKERQESKRTKRNGKVPRFVLFLGSAFTAMSVVFYNLTGSSFNFERWIIPRLCMGHFDLNMHDALWYLVGHLFGVVMAALLAYILIVYKRKTEKGFLRALFASDLANVV